MITQKFKIIGKPIHPNKHQTIFDMCEEYLINPERNENIDWTITSKQGAMIVIQNKNTLENFICRVNENL
jgi:hypothetical protein